MIDLARTKINYLHVVVAIVAFASVACHRVQVDKKHVEVVDLRREIAELQVPQSIFSKIEAMVEGKGSGHGGEHGGTHEQSAEEGHGESKSEGHGEPSGGGEHGGGSSGGGGGHGGGDGGGVALKTPLTMDYAEIVVYLTEKSGNVLSGQNIKVEFAKGGGTIDLANYLNKNAPGEFIFAVEAVGSISGKKVKAYFLNGGKKQ